MVPAMGSRLSWLNASLLNVVVAVSLMLLLHLLLPSLYNDGQRYLAAAQNTSSCDNTTASSNSSLNCNSTSAAPPTTTGSGSSNNVSSIASGTVVAALVVAGVIAVCTIRKRRRRKKWKARLRGGKDASALPSAAQDSTIPEELSSSMHDINGPQNFTLRQLREATKDFSEARLLGRGGFGDVYKGILADKERTVVAVKRIGDQSRQGIKEFRAELTSIGNLRHRNLVKLKGWCYAEGACMLVYEYMGNGSLDNLLFDDNLCGNLTWERRWGIALGLGSALRYLHDECDNIIIHRDVKASNVLLDDGFNAKLGDFGLSRQMGLGMTSHTTILAGTRGYMGPELFMGLGKATCESDVFAFGGVLLEIATGKSVIHNSLIESHEGMLLNWVWDMYGQGKLAEVVDKRMEESIVNLHEAKKLLIVGLACSHPDPKARPSIRHAMEYLNGAAELPWIPTSRPLPSYGTLPSMSRMSRLMGDSCTTESQPFSTTDSGKRTGSSSDYGVSNPLVYGTSSDSNSLV